MSAAEYDAAFPFEVRVASTLRFAMDGGALNSLLMSMAPGQSEHPGSPYYRDGLERWLDGRPQLVSTQRLLIEQSSAARLVLEPRS